MAQSATTTAVRSYRVYFRDGDNAIARTYDVDLASDEEAHQLAALMLEEQGVHACAEVWDRARLVCTIHRSHE